MGTEQEEVQRILEEMARAKSASSDLEYDPCSRRVRQRGSSNGAYTLNIAPEDARMFATEVPYVVLSEADIRFRQTNETCRTLEFACLDDGDVYTARRAGWPPGGVIGLIEFAAAAASMPVDASVDFKIRVAVQYRSSEATGEDPAETSVESVTALVHGREGWKRAEVLFVPSYDEIFSRSRGILESDVIANKEVLVVGAGSGGSLVVIGLAESGVMNFSVWDGDRIMPGNVSRHIAGVCDIGRKKTAFLADQIHQKNPYARVQTVDDMVTSANKEVLREFVARSDAVICATDTRNSRLIVNRLCVEEGKPCIIGASFRRAYGGQVLVIRPRRGPCYQCFVQALPEQAEDQQVSSDAAAERLAYSDRPVAVEPGLFNDVRTIAQMVVKLAIQTLVQGCATTLASLDEDLVAPWYLFLNRRDLDSPYANLAPLAFGVNGMRILRWYGIDLHRNPACPVCGDFVQQVSEQLLISLDPAAAQSFASANVALGNPEEGDTQ